MEVKLTKYNLTQWGKEKWAALRDVDLEDFSLPRSIIYHANKIVFQDGDLVKVLKDRNNV